MIPIMKPLLPKAEKLLPYLKKIDSNQWYSNSGPLVKEYEARLETFFCEPIVSCSSATAGLIATLIALGLARGSKVACPSWTFAATPAAIVAAGYVPIFCDVVGDMEVINTIVNVDAIIVVCPFGKSIGTIQAWESLSKRMNMPVVIDAAAAFDVFSTTHNVTSLPTVFSTHCTKTFSTGEGGFVTCSDKDFLTKVRTILNHGIAVDRSISYTGINGKMSEYNAAVGLAELDGWEVKRKKWMEVQGYYNDNTPYATSTHIVAVPDAIEVKHILAVKGIETRVAWYGIHTQDAYRLYPQTEMKETARLMRTRIALPKFLGMTPEQVEYITESVRQCGLQ